MVQRILRFWPNYFFAILIYNSVYFHLGMDPDGEVISKLSYGADHSGSLYCSLKILWIMGKKYVWDWGGISKMICNSSCSHWSCSFLPHQAFAIETYNRHHGYCFFSLYLYLDIRSLDLCYDASFSFR